MALKWLMAACPTGVLRERRLSRASTRGKEQGENNRKRREEGRGKK
jgi:hypothetical protein